MDFFKVIFVLDVFIMVIFDMVVFVVVVLTGVIFTVVVFPVVFFLGGQQIGWIKIIKLSKLSNYQKHLWASFCVTSGTFAL